MTKLAIMGAAGRMGGMLIRSAAAVDGVDIAAAIEQTDHPSIGTDSGLSAGIASNGVMITDDINAVAEASVMIDFTVHTVAPRNAGIVADMGKALVLGTTGLTDDEKAAITVASQRAPIVFAPNMSLGMNVLFAMVRRAATILDSEYDIEVVEMHHGQKKDAPSGTALRLAECAAEGRCQDLKDVAVYGREGMVGARPTGEIGVHAIRGGDIVGDHTVMFACQGERIDLSHRATSRDAFASGAVRAAGWVCGRAAGLYDMQDVLGLK